MCNLINTHTHNTHMRCYAQFNKYTHTHTQTHTHKHTHTNTETRAVAEMGTGTRTGTGTGTGKNEDGIGGAEERRRSARNHTRTTRTVDAMWETRESWLRGKRKTRRQERVDSVAANLDMQGSRGGSTRYPGLE